MKTLKEQYNAIQSSRIDLEKELNRTGKDKPTIREFLANNIEALIDAAETIKRVTSLVEFIMLSEEETK